MPAINIFNVESDYMCIQSNKSSFSEKKPCFLEGFHILGYACNWH